MNTTLSDQKAKEFLEKTAGLRRKIFEFEFSHPAAPEQLFPLLCPTREYDWIPGWDCNLLYSSTGFIERDAVFTTDFASPHGAEVWICSAYESYRKIEFIRFSNNVVIKLNIVLTDNGDGTTTSRWIRMYTALNKKGNKYIDSMPEDDHHKSIGELLNYYLSTGEKIKKPKLSLHEKIRHHKRK